MAAAIDPNTGLTVKQTAFCRAYIESGNAAQAYREAYDVAEDAKDGWIRVEACQLLDNPNVTREIQRLQEEAARLSLYTVKAAYDELEDARLLARDVKQPGAAVSAISAKIKLFGLDKPMKVLHGSDPDNPMEISETEIARRIAFTLAAALKKQDGPG